ncbi:MAG TPA: hypothetical protein VF460_00325 [Burkholderiales bacterium]
MKLEEVHAVAMDLLAAIHALSGYAVPASLPEIHAVPLPVMQQRVCGKPCAIKAYYHPVDGVFFDEKLDLANSEFDRSILLHELVHYLQKASGRFENMPAACERNQAAEAEAYKIQNLYLSSRNSPTRALFSGWTVRCDDSK